MGSPPDPLVPFPEVDLLDRRPGERRTGSAVRSSAVKATGNRYPRRSNDVIYAPGPQPELAPGQTSHTMPIAPWLPRAHEYRAPQHGLAAKLTAGVDWFWFALTFVLWVCVPVVGLVMMIGADR